MPELSPILLAVASLLVAGFGLLLIPFSMPGNWIIAAAGLAGPLIGVGWIPFLILLAAAIVSEIIEFLLTTKTAKKAGAGHSGQWGAFIGGVVGAILGTPLIPVPILGTLIGSALGAFGGAVVFELVFAGQESKKLLGIGLGAFLGVILGKGAKIALGAFQLGFWAFALYQQI